MEGMGERAHGRQRQQRGWPGQPAPSLPGARATPAQPASGGGCLPQPRWAVCATGAGDQGQTSREGEKDIWWTAETAKGRTGDCPGPRKGATTRRNVTQGAGEHLCTQQNWRAPPRQPARCSLDVGAWTTGRHGHGNGCVHLKLVVGPMGMDAIGAVCCTGEQCKHHSSRPGIGRIWPELAGNWPDIGSCQT